MQNHTSTPDSKACLIETFESNMDFSPSTDLIRKPIIPAFHTQAMRMASGSENILLLDLDNTLTDTRRWFASFILEATSELADALGACPKVVNSLYAEVASATTLHEYAYVVEAICSRLRMQQSLSYKAIAEISHQFWNRFAREHEKIELYDGVIATLTEIRSRFKELKIVILTDSPEWVALERLAITGILPLVDGVVAIRTDDPKLRQRGYRECIKIARQRVDAKQSKVDKKHLLLNASIPAAFAKPSSAGIELIARKFGAVNGQLIICGDKDTKEGQAAAQWRKRRHLLNMPESRIHYVRANYGNHDLHHETYAELARHIPSLSGSKSKNTPAVPLLSSIERFDHLLHVLAEALSDRDRKPAVA